MGKKYPIGITTLYFISQEMEEKIESEFTDFVKERVEMHTMARFILRMFIPENHEFFMQNDFLGNMGTLNQFK